MKILQSHAVWDSTGHYGSIRGIVTTLLNEKMIEEQAVQIIGFIAENLFLLISVVCFFISKTKWQSALFISGVLASYLGYNWAYTAAYYLPALLVFLQENGENMLRDKESEKINTGIFVNTIGYALIFSVPWFFQYICDGGMYEGVFLISYFILMLNAVTVLVQFIFKGIRKNGNY